MAGTSTKTEIVSLRVPKALLARIDAIGSRRAVMLAAVEAYVTQGDLPPHPLATATSVPVIGAPAAPIGSLMKTRKPKKARK